ncbi:LysR substrate binding domain protein [Acetobacteraceae bacterium AT-5844]|nr:LysR substrate binding domain protein [Acetobacteraceae bacterium AT-5844]
MRGADFAELMGFMAVVEERNFRRAAQRLALSPSALSHSIRSLEQRLGARLLNRTTRSVAPTAAGQALYERLRPAILEMDGAVRDVGAFQVQPSGVVRLNTPRIAAGMVVLPKLVDFRTAYPSVRLDLVIDDSMTDVVAKGFDAGIRSGTLVQQDMAAVRLTPDLRMAVVGSPGYFAGRPSPKVPDDLQYHVCLTYRWRETGAMYRWRFDGPDGVIEVNVENALTVNDSDLLLGAALRGLGLAFLPESFVEEALAHGELVRVLDEWCRPFSGFHLYYPRKPHMPAALRAFIDFMRLSR